MIGPLPVGPLDHVAVAVLDLDEACERFGRRLGCDVGYREVVAGQGVEVAFLVVPGQTSVELIAPTSPESTVARFLDKRGEGLHHVCFQVEDVDEALARAVELGLPVIDREARPGAGNSRIGFLHPAAFAGVLVELKQKPTG